MKQKQKTHIFFSFAKGTYRQFVQDVYDCKKKNSILRKKHHFTC
jgi:hypothetical protein